MRRAPTVRAFAALELPPEALGALTQVMDGLGGAAPPAAVRWVRPEGIHLTLKFYGEVAAARIPDVQKMLAAVAARAAPAQLALSEVGAFPNVRRPRVIWVGIAGDIQPLGALAEAVEAGSQALGFEPEGRGFHPHLTLGRVQPHARPAVVRRISEMLASFRRVASAPFALTTLALMRSQPGPGGSIYTPVWQARLGGPNAPAMLESRPAVSIDQEENRSEPN